MKKKKKETVIERGAYWKRADTSGQDWTDRRLYMATGSDLERTDWRLTW